MSDVDKLNAPRSNAKPGWRQFSVRALVLVIFLASVFLGRISAELRKDHRRRLAYQQLEMEIYTCSGDLPFSWQSSWLHKLRGEEESYDLTFLALHNTADVNRETFTSIAQFENLKSLSLNGEISISDADLEFLKGLKGLRDLWLADAPVTARAVDSLRRSLPECEIRWEPRQQVERNPP